MNFSDMTLGDSFGWIGGAVSIFFLFTPAPKIIKLCRKKLTYKDINSIILLANYISCIIWLIYGYTIKCPQITVCYSIGAVISLAWVWTYLVYVGKSRLNQALIYTMILSIGSFSIYIFLGVLIKNKNTLGKICLIACSISYITPVHILYKAIKDQTYGIIPIYTTSISGVGFLSWTIFGLIKFNFNIAIPHFIGALFSLFEIVLWRINKKKKELVEEHKLSNVSNVSNNFDNAPEQASQVVQPPGENILRNQPIPVAKEDKVQDDKKVVIEEEEKNQSKDKVEIPVEAKNEDNSKEE